MQPHLVNKLAPVILTTLIACTTAFGFTTPSENVFRSDGSAADTQAAINAAPHGATVQLPGGVFTWTSPVKMTKALKLQGAGAGRVILRSQSSNTIGTGEKTFNVTLDRFQNRAPVPGETLRFWRFGFRLTFMEGTVTSYSQGTLVMNMTSSGGSGTHVLWVAATPPATTVVHGTGNTPMFDITSTTAGRSEVSGIKFAQGPSSGNDGYMLHLHGGPNNAPMLLHDLFFEIDGNMNGATASGFVAIRSGTGNVVLYNSSFNQAAVGGPIGVHIQEWGENSWALADTMGARDTNGKHNFYIEDCDFHNTGATDFDDYARAVIRRTTFNNCGMASHGADSSNIGMRHVEVYENEFVFDNRIGVAPNLTWYFYWRGGTGVWADNIMPPLLSTDWGDKPEIYMTVYNLWRNGGPFNCWGNGGPKGRYGNATVRSISAGNPAVVTTSEHFLSTGDRVRFDFGGGLASVAPEIHTVGSGDGRVYEITVTSPTTFTIPVHINAGFSGTGTLRPVDWPAPHQQGQGHDGTKTILDPIYMWGNTTDGRTPIQPEVRISEDASGNTCGPYCDFASDYIKIGRDVINDGSRKPGYTKFEYPHPARQGTGSGANPRPPTGLRIIP